MIKFFLVIVCLSLAFFCCDKKCQNCVSVAFRIRLVDETAGVTLKNAVVVAKTSSQNADTGVYSTEDSAYVVFGLPGTYTISVSQENYDSFTVRGLVVDQWSEDQCEAHANTLHLTIQVTPAASVKSTQRKSSSYRILQSYASGGC